MSKTVLNLLVICMMLFVTSSLNAQVTVDLTVVQSQSVATVSVLGGSDDTSITGNAVLDLDSATEPFSTAHITDLNLTMEDGFEILLLAGTVSISVEPQGASVQFAQVGEIGTVDANNQFDQIGNLFSATGMSLVDSGIFGTSMIDLSTVKPVPFDVIDAVLSVDGDQLTLSTAVNIDFEFEVLGGTATMNLNGPLVLVGTLPSQMLLGDINCDGSIDLLDVAPFVDMLAAGTFSEKADINQDGSFDLLDVQPFVNLLAGN